MGGIVIAIWEKSNFFGSNGSLKCTKNTIFLQGGQNLPPLPLVGLKRFLQNMFTCAMLCHPLYLGRYLFINISIYILFIIYLRSLSVFSSIFIFLVMSTYFFWNLFTAQILPRYNPIVQYIVENLNINSIYLHISLSLSGGEQKIGQVQVKQKEAINKCKLFLKGDELILQS